MLNKLPTEIKEFVSQGVYSIYEIESTSSENEAYILITDNKKFIVTDKEGSNPKVITSIKDYVLGDLVTLPSFDKSSLIEVNNAI